MKSFTRISTLFLWAHCAMAGNLNVINLTSEAPLELILSTDSGDKKLSVGQGSATGSFKLNEGSVTLKPSGDDLPELEIPSSEENQLAIFFTASDSTEWKLIPSRPKIDKWAFHVVNLTGQVAEFSHDGEDLTVEAGEELELKISSPKGLKITLPDGKPQSPDFREPRTVVAFLHIVDEETVITFVSDL
ncbi:hypothetical protein [Luteolibacter sp. AS25]|uniref:hypothetical protein n=1 Tax=Luteolibacter sp. AS25 TaxID=3135776 RepID=UPI00398BAADC